MMIGRIAESYLSSSELSSVNNLIQSFQLPKQTLTESATWQDMLKDDYGLRLFYQWHFSDEIIKGDSCENCVFRNPTYNITSYLASAYKTLNDKTTTSPWIWAFHIRSVAHFVGDVHMPLHNTERFANDYPEGDKGGNDYKLNCNYGSACNNIHFLWDSAGNMYNLEKPLTPNHADTFSKNCSNLMKTHPESSIGYDTKSFAPYMWHNESFQIAQGIYTTPANEWPSEAYLNNVHDKSKLRIALAGYRLGNFIKSVVGNMPVVDKANYVREIVVWVVNSVMFIVSIVMLILTKRKNQYTAMY